MPPAQIKDEKTYTELRRHGESREKSAPDRQRGRGGLAQVSAALKRARRRDIPAKATVIPAALRSAQLGQPPAVTAAYTITVRSLVAVITVVPTPRAALPGGGPDVRPGVSWWPRRNGVAVVRTRRWRPIGRGGRRLARGWW